MSKPNVTEVTQDGGLVGFKTAKGHIIPRGTGTFWQIMNAIRDAQKAADAPGTSELRRDIEPMLQGTGLVCRRIMRNDTYHNFEIELIDTLNGDMFDRVHWVYMPFEPNYLRSQARMMSEFDRVHWVYMPFEPDDALVLADKLAITKRKVAARRLKSRVRKLSASYRDWVYSKPKVKPEAARPGDILIRLTHTSYRIESVSKTGAKVMARPVLWDTQGVGEPERLSKAERQDDYYLFTQDDLDRLLSLNESLRRINACVERKLCDAKELS